MDVEKEKMRQALLIAAPHHQGASSVVGKAIAEALDLPFPLRMEDINKARRASVWDLVQANIS